MNGRTRKSFPLFELTIIVALALIGWVSFRLYQIVPEVDQSRNQLAAARSQYLHISRLIESHVTGLATALARYLEHNDAGQLTQFRSRSAAFRHWIDYEQQRWSQSQPVEPTQPTNRLSQIQSQLLPLFERLQIAYEGYTNAAEYLIQNAGTPPVRARWEAHERSQQQWAAAMVELAREAIADSENLESYLSWPQQRYANLRTRFQSMRFTLLLALIGLSFLLMLVIYRRHLGQSRQIIEQHKRQQLEQQAKLDKLTHFGRLAHELAHEIKQPLTAISARIYTLQKLLPPNNEAHKDAALVRSEIKRLNQIVKDFQELARPAEPKLIPLTAGKALHEVSDLLGSQLEQEGIQFKCDAEEQLEILADPQQLEQVLLNLIRNAAESIESNGTVILRARKANCTLKGQTGEVAAIEVVDNGPGIPPEVQNRIFDPFFSTKEGGTGLGLAIAARIIDKHGGNLEFDTEPGKGTVFRILLPVCAKHNQHQHEQSPTH